MPKMKETPQYIRNLLMPTGRAKRGRRVWSIDLETIWLPFFTATNTMGDTAIPYDALGAPLRLAYAKDGSVKFSPNGRPTIRVAKPISESVALVRDNFVAHLQQYTEQVATDRQDDYASQVKMSIKAGEPIINHDRIELDKAVKAQLEEAMRKAEAETPEAEAETPETEPDMELVTA